MSPNDWVGLPTMFQLAIADEEGNQRLVPLAGRTSIGRQEGNDVLLDDQRVSRRHARIECTDTDCHITDLESSNGTIMDGERLHPKVPVEFRPGSVVRIGSFELTLRSVPVPEQAPEEPAAHPAVPVEAVEEPEAQEPHEPLGASDGGADHVQPPPPPTPPSPEEPTPPADAFVPPGLTLESRRLISYLPGIYHTAFVARFLGIFESILTPIEWTIDGFDLFLDPGTAPIAFIPWLANWFDITFSHAWTNAQRRQLLREAHAIYARRGTKWALSRTLEIYTGQTPTIVDTGSDVEPFTFKVVLPRSHPSLDQAMIERLVDAHKPAHTQYTVEYASTK